MTGVSPSRWGHRRTSPARIARDLARIRGGERDSVLAGTILATIYFIAAPHSAVDDVEMNARPHFISRARRTYVHGEPYRLARGRYAPSAAVVDVTAATHAVIDLDRERVDAATFLTRVDREMKIRFYQPKTRKSYRIVLAGFLRWLNAPPHTATRESVREWLELLVDGGAKSACADGLARNEPARSARVDRARTRSVARDRARCRANANADVGGPHRRAHVARRRRGAAAR